MLEALLYKNLKKPYFYIDIHLKIKILAVT